MSSQLSQCQLSLPPEPALDHDDSVFWWDGYVSEFPSNFYTLISSEDFNQLLNDLDEFNNLEADVFNEADVFIKEADVFIKDAYMFIKDEYMFIKDTYMFIKDVDMFNHAMDP